MKDLVESVKEGGVNQPALVRPREDGGYEIIAGHRRQKASELAGYFEMPCIVREMTDDEAVLAITDDNLRQRFEILPSERAISLKMQVDAISHQGARTSGQIVDISSRSAAANLGSFSFRYTTKKSIKRAFRLWICKNLYSQLETAIPAAILAPRFLKKSP